MIELKLKLNVETKSLKKRNGYEHPTIYYGPKQAQFLTRTSKEFSTAWKIKN